MVRYWWRSLRPKSAPIPSLGTHFFGALAEERVRALRWEVGVEGVEGWRAESLEHLENAHIHPGRSAGVRVLEAG